MKELFREVVKLSKRPVGVFLAWFAVGLTCRFIFYLKAHSMMEDLSPEEIKSIIQVTTIYGAHRGSFSWSVTLYMLSDIAPLIFIFAGAIHMMIYYIKQISKVELKSN